MSSVKIDGNRIRQLREEKELTQLYLATVVGVTTDTISRWENGRYSSIKIENGRKLAAALETPIEELLQAQDGTTKEIPRADKSKVHPGKISTDEEIRLLPLGRIKQIAMGFCVLSLLALVLYFSLKINRTTLSRSVQASRITPTHTAPGISFPVIIMLRGNAEADHPVLIREKLIGAAEASGWPQNSDNKQFKKSPRWIGKLDNGEARFQYMVHPAKHINHGEEILFSGETFIREEQQEGRVINGKGHIQIAPFHWADTNRDNSISDNEILLAYETYSTPDENSLYFTLIEEIWLAGKYKWNEKSFSFEFAGATIIKE